MDKLLIKKPLNWEARQSIHILGGVFVVVLFTLAAAVFTVSAVQADAILPATQPPSPITVTFPQFTISARHPHFQKVSDTLAAEPLAERPQWFRGVASWYGPSFNGRLTANGEVYDMYAMTAATTEFHPELPLGTKVQVVNSHNGRSVVVRITDRGPLPPGRIIDLSYGAARKLAMVKPGIAHVRIHVLRWGNDRYHREAAD